MKRRRFTLDHQRLMSLLPEGHSGSNFDKKIWFEIAKKYFGVSKIKRPRVMQLFCKYAKTKAFVEQRSKKRCTEQIKPTSNEEEEGEEEGGEEEEVQEEEEGNDFGEELKKNGHSKKEGYGGGSNGEDMNGTEFEEEEEDEDLKEKNKKKNDSKKE